MSASASHRSVLSYLYNHNPFYVISAVLMLYAVRSAYGTIEIGSINCWIMMGVLAGYTLLLAGIGVLIVRWGKVFEDARSILLILLLLFLGVSVSMDDLFSRITPDEGMTLMLAGFLFSALVSEAVLWGTGIRFGARYRIPYHLFLALFYVAPWWYSPEMHPRSAVSLEWTLLSFPVVASVLFLCLMPAIRGGVDYVKGNGTPWGWPLFPWIAFGVIAACVALRSFALCLTFGPTGPMWISNGSGPRLISFDTLWGFYFLIPLAFVILLMLLEGSLVTKNVRFQKGVIRFAPFLLLLAMPAITGKVQLNFLYKVTDVIGSPIWITVWLLIGFYTWAAVRRVPGAVGAGLGVLALLAIVGPETLGTRTLIKPTPWPLVVDGLLILAWGVHRRASVVAMAGVLVATCGFWYLAPGTMVQPYRFSISFHIIWMAALILGLTTKGFFSELILWIAGGLFPLVTIAVMWTPQATEVPMLWKLSYVSTCLVGCVIVARFRNLTWFWLAFAGSLGILIYTSGAYAFHLAARVLSPAAVTAFIWSAGALLLAFLISAHKARWLPEYVTLMPKKEPTSEPELILPPPPPEGGEPLKEE